jgi:hypothetical protein
MEQKEPRTPAPTSYKEVKVGKTIFRVTSVYLGEKDLGKTLEQLAVRKAMNDIRAGAVS